MQTATIGRLNYQIGAETGDLRRDTQLSRSEIGMVRRAMRESKTDAERYAEQLDVLTRAMHTGAITSADYVDTVAALQAKTPQAVAAAKALADETRRGEQITLQYLTAEERHEAQARDLKAMLDNQSISQETYTRALRDSEQTLPSVIAAEERRNRELAEAAQITDRATTAEERYDRETQDLKRHLDAGRISQETYTRSLAEAENRLPSVRQAERERTEAMQRSEQWTRSLETATEKYQREMQELTTALRRGEISQELYARGARRAADSIQSANPGRIASGMSSMQTRMIGMAAAAFSVHQAFATMRDGVVEAMGRIDETAKNSRKLGFEESGDLIGLQMAASEYSGVDGRTTNTAVQRMVRRIAEAANGTGEARGALRELKLDAKELAQLSPDQQFAAVADAISQIGNQGDAVRLTMKMVDSEGVALVNTFRAGSSGLAAVRAEADALGLTFSDVDAAKVEAANDAIGRASMALDGMWNTLAIEFAPEVVVVSEELQNWAKWLRSGNAELDETADKVGFIGKVFKGLGLLRDHGVMGVLNGSAAAATLADGITSGLTPSAPKREPIDTQSPADVEMQRMESQMNTLRRKAEEAENGQSDANRNALKQSGASPEMLAEYDRLQKRIAAAEALKKAEADAAQSAKQAAAEKQSADDQAQRQAEQLTQQLETKAERLQRELGYYRDLRDAGRISDQTFARAKRKAEQDARGGAEKQGAPSTAGRGTAEAYKMIVDAMRAQAADKPEDKIVAATEKGNSELEKLNGKIEQLGDVFGSVG
ncbi:hypothetical protein Poly24_08900 [Rosistilla carotiformis]|uniref:Uncharacterized protein n=1 Tax=Rosistilla carotiformis TaxID=2528017 RepID=A0A518JNV7_9BACT|nr:hypothetical protein [Rosistilla carotiformis]QDV67198.1 hypothetical protein Poly24_08900 [Rosistilla carotiformis]